MMVFSTGVEEFLPVKAGFFKNPRVRENECGRMMKNGVNK